MTSRQLSSEGVAGLLLACAVSFVLGDAVEAEEARPSIPVAPDSGPCSKVEVEKAIRRLDDKTILKLVKALPETEDRWPTVYGWKVGRFFDPSCHVAMVNIGSVRFNAVNVVEEAIFLKLVNERLAIVKRLPFDQNEVDQIGDSALRLADVVDFDHDGRDEVLTEENSINTGEPDDHSVGKLFHILGFRSRKLEALWRSEILKSWHVVKQCRSEESGPCETGSIALSFVDLDGNGIDEVVVHSKRAEYRDPELTKLVSRDETREVFWYDGTRFSAKRAAASPTKAALKALSKTPPGALARFQARLSEQDHVNGQTGTPLKFAAHVIRQDRANLHSTKRPDPEDTSDSLYDKASARTTLTVLLEKAISPTESDRIMKGTPLVDVTVWPDRADVLILSE